jgi:hypothetical protein
MMATTHALYGMAAGAATLWVAPEYAPDKDPIDAMIDALQEVREDGD